MILSLSHLSTNSILGSYSPLSIEDNEGDSTIEIIDENGNLIWENKLNI